MAHADKWPASALELRPSAGREVALWAVVVAWTALWAWLLATPSGISWHYFHDGAGLLFHGPGLHLYANHPELQIGPLTLVVAAVFRTLGPGAELATAQILMTAALPTALAALRPLIRPEGRRGRILAAALVLAPTWTVLSVRWAHLDDVLALLLLCLAVRAVGTDRAGMAGVYVACAVAAKPWAAVGLALILYPTGGRGLPALFRPTRRSGRRGGVVAAGLGIALAWLPFVAADVGTLSAFHPLVEISESSVLRLFGYGGRYIPTWDRVAQLTLAPLAALVAVMLRAWPAALLCGVAARIALDPQDIAYYAASAAMAAAVCDLVGTRWRLPWTTLLTALAMWQPFVADYSRRLETSRGLSLWWFTHPQPVAAVHLLWALTAPVLGVVGCRAADHSASLAHPSRGRRAGTVSAGTAPNRRPPS